MEAGGRGEVGKEEREREREQENTHRKERKKEKKERKKNIIFPFIKLATRLVPMKLRRSPGSSFATIPASMKLISIFPSAFLRQIIFPGCRSFEIRNEKFHLIN